MAYQKQYRTIVPLEKDADTEVALWLVRESFELQAERDSSADDRLHIFDFEHRVIGHGNLPPKVAKQLGRPISDFQWVEYVGTGRRA